MAQFSFDIISSYDKAEMNNVYQQTEKEIASRYDFRGTAAAIEWLPDKKGIKAIADSPWQLEQVVDLYSKKLAARDMTRKVLQLDGQVHESNMRAWQDIPFRDGLSQDNAKKITKLLKERHSKLKTQIQGDEIRVTGTSKDELQAAMQTVKAADLDFPVVFTNFR